MLLSGVNCARAFSVNIPCTVFSAMNPYSTFKNTDPCRVIDSLYSSTTVQKRLASLLGMPSRGHSFSTYARRGGEGGSSKCVRMRTRGEGGVDTLSTYAKQKIITISFLQTSCNIFIYKGPLAAI